MSASNRRFAVPVEMRGRRLDHYLSAQLPELSRTRLQQLIREGRVHVNSGVSRRAGMRLRGGEMIVAEVVERPPLKAVAEDIPLQVLYEDDALIAIDKPAGMVVHVGAGVRRGTLVNALLHRFEQLSSVGGAMRPGIVHRLDKATSGVLLVAKNDEAHRRLAAQFSKRAVEKRYVVLVHGRLKKKTGCIRLPVSRDRARRTRMTTRRRSGRTAETEYHVLQTRSGFSLLEAFPRTGRTHQVRVHFSSLGRPVVGDTVYGAPRLLRWDNQTAPPLGRIFLHAECVRFFHPGSAEAMEVHAALPRELTTLLERIGFHPPASN